MPRYLTPSKVGLLALIAIYVEGLVPNSSAIDVLSFLMNHVLHNPPNSTTVVSIDSEDPVPVKAFERTLSPLTSSFPGRTVWDSFLKKLWSIDCADTLHSFLTNTNSLLVKSRQEREKEAEKDPDDDTSYGQQIARTSPLGAFIRRAHLEFTRLQFHDAISLWESFISYRLPTRSAWEKKNQPHGKHALDQNLFDLNLDGDSPLTRTVYRNVTEEDEASSHFSSHDVEKLLEFQVSEIQSEPQPILPILPTDIKGLGTRLPEEMGKKIRGTVRSGLPVPNLMHYLRYALQRESFITLSSAVS